jgi:MFS family permease
MKPDERRALGVAFVFHFIVLASYYVLRPIRDEIGAAGGLDNLPWMFAATLVAMLLANAVFSAIVARLARRRFIAIAYRFFILNLALFFVLMRTLPAAGLVWVGRAFYVWVSVFNLFVVTVFWSFMTDVFNTEQAKRLFGFIAVGGTLGAIAGGSLTAFLVQRLGAANLLLISAAFLECGAWCVRFFPTPFKGEHASADRREVGTSNARSAARSVRESWVPSARPICWASAASCCCTPSQQRWCTSNKRTSRPDNSRTGRRARRSLRSSTSG